MIYVTGDTHGLQNTEKLDAFFRTTPLTKADYLIIAGDSGILWSEKSNARRLAFYDGLPCSILFVDGNHENFDQLNACREEDFCGGRVHRVGKSILHLMRGQVYEIEGKRIFCFGGATSIDWDSRTDGISRWLAERPTVQDYDTAMQSLSRVGFSVDYIITHTIDERALYHPLLRAVTAGRRVYPESNMLTNIEDAVCYRHWYFGHYHVDGNINDRKTVLFNRILPLGACVEE